MNTRRTQPLRTRSARATNPALKAAQRGRSNLISPADIRRAALRKRKRRRYRGKAQNSSPLHKILGIRRTLS